MLQRLAARYQIDPTIDPQRDALLRPPSTEGQAETPSDDHGTSLHDGTCHCLRGNGPGAAETMGQRPLKQWTNGLKMRMKHG